MSHPKHDFTTRHIEVEKPAEHTIDPSTHENLPMGNFVETQQKADAEKASGVRHIAESEAPRSGFRGKDAPTMVNDPTPKVEQAKPTPAKVAAKKPAPKKPVVKFSVKAPHAAPNIVLQFGDRGRLVYTHKGKGGWEVYNEAYETTELGVAEGKDAATSDGYWVVTVPPPDRFGDPLPFEGDAEAPRWVATLEETELPRVYFQ